MNCKLYKKKFPYYIVRFKLAERWKEIDEGKEFPYYIVRFKRESAILAIEAEKEVSILHSTI